MVTRALSLLASLATIATSYAGCCRTVCAPGYTLSGSSCVPGSPPPPVTTSACADPTALTATSITANSADLSWTEMGTATAWWLSYSSSDGSGSEMIVTSNPRSVTGLSPGTTYDFSVQSICADSESGWAAPFEFTTSPLTVGQNYTLRIEGGGSIGFKQISATINGNAVDFTGPRYRSEPYGTDPGPYRAWTGVEQCFDGDPDNGVCRNLGSWGKIQLLAEFMAPPGGSELVVTLRNHDNNYCCVDVRGKRLRVTESGNDEWEVPDVSPAQNITMHTVGSSEVFYFTLP